MQASCIKYSSRGKFYDIEGAAAELKKLNERWPNREHVILMNVRAGKKYAVCQVEHVTVDVPTEEELDLPPLPNLRWNSATDLEWAHYKRVKEQREYIKAQALEPAKKALRAVMPR